MSFKTISEEGFPDSEEWTCDKCGYSIHLQGTGGDVAECPECVSREYAKDAAQEEEMQKEAAQKEYTTVVNITVYLGKKSCEGLYSQCEPNTPSAYEASFFQPTKPIDIRKLCIDCVRVIPKEWFNTEGREFQFKEKKGE